MPFVLVSAVGRGYGCLFYSCRVPIHVGSYGCLLSDVVVVIELGAYIHGVLTFNGCLLSRFYGT